MKVLVIGGTGMIGAGIVEKCVEASFCVTVAHRGKTSAPYGAISEDVQIDRHTKRFHQFLKERAFDFIVDLACYDASTAKDLVNIVPNGQRLLVASTVLVTGGGVATPLTESATVSAGSEYARNKVEMEDEFRRANASGRVRSIILRLGACYREGCYLDGQLFEDSYWLHALKAGRPSLLADDGTAFWSVLHARDAGEIVVRLLLQPDALCETLLAANPDHINWRDYYALAADAIGGRFVLRSVPSDWLVDKLGDRCFLQEMSRWDQIYNLRKLENLIGPFRPKISLHDGLTQAIFAYAARGRIMPNASARRTYALLKEWDEMQSERKIASHRTTTVA